ncbi:MAG: hypothetical protein ACHQ4F_05870 [Candidatus Dormibacteria bacterium]
MTEIESATPAPSGPAVLDIGGGTGALLVIVPAALLHTEIEVSPEQRPRDRTHTGVHGRPMNGDHVPIALFPSLDAGTWTLWGSGSCATRSVEILDGQVTEVDWR